MGWWGSLINGCGSLDGDWRAEVTIGSISERRASSERCFQRGFFFIIFVAVIIIKSCSLCGVLGSSRPSISSHALMIVVGWSGDVEWDGGDGSRWREP